MKNRIMAFRDVYRMFLDIWNLYRKYADSSLTDKECREAVEEAERLRKKYNSTFANEVLTAVMCELSRTAKLKESRK